MPTKTKTAAKAKPAEKTKPKASEPNTATPTKAQNYDVWKEVYAETNRFMVDRWQQAFDVPYKIMQCSTPLEAFQVHADYLQEGIKQYAEEGAYLMNMVYESTHLPRPDLSLPVKRKFNDVPV